VTDAGSVSATEVAEDIEEILAAEAEGIFSTGSSSGCGRPRSR
jgi:hypothetical protein